MLLFVVDTHAVQQKVWIVYFVTVCASIKNVYNSTHATSGDILSLDTKYLLIKFHVTSRYQSAANESYHGVPHSSKMVSGPSIVSFPVSSI